MSSERILRSLDNRRLALRVRSLGRRRPSWCAFLSSRQALPPRAGRFWSHTDMCSCVELHSDLVAHWKIEYRPKRKLLMLIVEVIIGFGLGWVPGPSPVCFPSADTLVLTMFPFDCQASTIFRTWAALRWACSSRSSSSRSSTLPGRTNSSLSACGFSSSPSSSCSTSCSCATFTRAIRRRRVRGVGTCRAGLRLRTT